MLNQNKVNAPVMDRLLVQTMKFGSTHWGTQKVLTKMPFLKEGIRELKR